MNTLKLIGRNKYLFDDDIDINEIKLSGIISSSRFLIIGGAGSIGQSVVKQIFKKEIRQKSMLLI